LESDLTLKTLENNIFEDFKLEARSSITNNKK